MYSLIVYLVNILKIKCDFSQHHSQDGLSCCRRCSEWYLCHPDSWRVWQREKEDAEECGGDHVCVRWGGQHLGGMYTPRPRNPAAVTHFFTTPRDFWPDVSCFPPEGAFSFFIQKKIWSLLNLWLVIASFTNIPIETLIFIFLRCWETVQATNDFMCMLLMQGCFIIFTLCGHLEDL